MPDALAAHMAKASRNACTPDVARALSRIWYETRRPRASFPPIQVPDAHPVGRPAKKTSSSSKYVASLIPGGEFREMPGDVWSEEDMVRIVEAIRRFAAASSELRPSSIRVLSTVLFTDIVGLDREAGVARRPGGRTGRTSTTRSSATRSVAGAGSRTTPRATASIATFDGPARAIRCAQDDRRERCATSGSRSGRESTPASAR